VTAPERYVDARELARLMGVSRSTVGRMLAAGMPSESWGLKRTRRFLPSEAMAWAQARVPETEPERRLQRPRRTQQPKE
jgi:predicted DNA-binding transcriptional regulator AlpA